MTNVIKSYLSDIPALPGVYQMIDKKGSILYIGKAKNLSKRVYSYTKIDKLTERLVNMVLRVAHIEIITTNTETEALLLEASMIRSLKPKYNILLKDDKSFPYILLRQDHEFGSITKYRGDKTTNGQYFGPFASTAAVDNTVDTLQHIFQLRTCSDHYFASRKRPCMLYQIGRCSAPCVGKIDSLSYNQLIDEARDFLTGKSARLQVQLKQAMQEASHRLDYEKAAIYRNRSKALAVITSKQVFANMTISDADILAIYSQNGRCCVQVFMFRAGQSYGNKPYFPIHTEENNEHDIMAAFIGQFYQTHQPPAEILVNCILPEKTMLEQALSSLAGFTVKVIIPVRGKKKELLTLCYENAQAALLKKLLHPK